MLFVKESAGQVLTSSCVSVKSLRKVYVHRRKRSFLTLHFLIQSQVFFPRGDSLQQRGTVLYVLYVLVGASVMFYQLFILQYVLYSTVIESDKYSIYI
jgi:hypothetical protein